MNRELRDEIAEFASCLKTSELDMLMEELELLDAIMERDDLGGEL